MAAASLATDANFRQEKPFKMFSRLTEAKLYSPTAHDDKGVIWRGGCNPEIILNQHNEQALTALKPSCTVLYIGRLLDRSIKPHPSEGRRGRIGEERGLFPREEIERVQLETREVDIDLIQ